MANVEKFAFNFMSRRRPRLLELAVFDARFYIRLGRIDEPDDVFQ
jgi:hypothetical protein